MSMDRIIKILLLVVLVLFIGYVIYRLLKKNKKSVFNKPIDTNTDDSNQSCTLRPTFNFASLLTADTSNSVQTEFFKESADYALKIVKGEEPICIDGLTDKSIKILNSLKCLNENEKANIYIVIQYVLITNENLEEQMRQISYAEEIPMWLIFIREGINKTNVCLQDSPLTISYCKAS